MSTEKEVIGLTDEGTLEVKETTNTTEVQTYFYQKDRLLKKRDMLRADLVDCEKLLSHFLD